MGNDDNRSATGKLLEGGLNLHLGGVVEGAGGLVKNKELWVLKEHTCDGNSLTLTARELHTTLTNLCIIAVVESCNIVVDIGLLCRCYNLFIGGILAAVGNILAHSAVKEEDGLGDDADILS